MRRKPQTQSNGSYNNNNQHKRPRFQGGGSGGDYRPQGGAQHHNRPRKNYTAMREKYLTQARDALASGDRVLAENYFQHADHCYRMMVEEGQLRPNYTPPPASAENPQDGTQPETGNEHVIPENSNQLPAFLTANYEEPAKPAEPVVVQGWDE